MQLIGEFKLGEEEKNMLWTAIFGWFACLIITMIMNYRLAKDKNEVLFLQIKNEVLKELNERKKN